VANNNKKMQELGLPTLAAEFTNFVPETSAAKKGGKKHIVKIRIRIHQSFSLTMMIKEIVRMMMTPNLMSCQNQKKLRSLFYHPSSSCGIVALHISVFSLLSNIWSCFHIHVLHF
jgi:hypothetical protein